MQEKLEKKYHFTDYKCDFLNSIPIPCRSLVAESKQKIPLPDFSLKNFHINCKRFRDFFQRI